MEPKKRMFHFLYAKVCTCRFNLLLLFGDSSFISLLMKMMIIIQVLEGLVYLHEQGVIRRDIKGANILTTKGGLVKLADFGVAAKLTEADLNTHSIVGTPYWMAAEVIEMSGVCAASDSWSVGYTVIELLTCVPPYYDLQTMPALYRIVRDEHPPIPDGISPDITDFLCQCLKKVLHTLFNLCKINKRRQEQAAENGIIPHFIMSDSPLKQFALPLLCDMAHASRNSREQLRVHCGLDVYLNLLEDEVWSVTALDSIAVCLAHDNDSCNVEQALLKEDAVQKKSSQINTTLAVNGLTSLLITRLDHQDAIVRLNLLKLIKAVYEHHPWPKKLIVENDLPQKLRDLIEERRNGERSGGQVLVKQMATSLLKALHINSVL